MKKVLIISPYFPPLNAPDMQRVRMSLPYFKENGWDVELITVDKKYADINKDALLLQTITPEIKIHRVEALNKKWTSKIGLGSIALRALPFYLKRVNLLLKTGKYQLIYFSTTQFPVCILGAYWKKRFKIPYIIDMQDPWHSDYYKDKPKAQRPSKYWFSYLLNKYLEPVAINSCDGLISVSPDYIADLKKRYPSTKNTPFAVITFGAFEKDMEIAENNSSFFKPLLDRKFKNLVYIGRGGDDMHKAITPVFEALKAGLSADEGFYSQLKLYFIGTSYAATGKGIPTILPLAKKMGLANSVIEITGRVSFYHTLITLKQADALFIPGSDDPRYTASKIFPYLQTLKPVLAIFNSNSPAINVLKEFGTEHIYCYDKPAGIRMLIDDFFKQVISGTLAEQKYNCNAVKKYSAQMMAKRQCDLFNLVC